MKTRTLLLWALACGVAIMLAGAVFLVQLVVRDEPEPPVEVGTPTEVGDVTATVTDASENGGVLAVSVVLEAPPNVDPTTGFRLIASGRSVEPQSIECPDDCVIRFDVSAVDGTARALFYERGEEQAWWALA